jgi:hypothetical protein
MRSGGLRIVVVPTKEPGIAGKVRKRLVSWESYPKVSQLHAGLAWVAGKQLEVSVHLAVYVADHDQLAIPFLTGTFSQSCESQSVGNRNRAHLSSSFRLFCAVGTISLTGTTILSYQLP